MQLQSSWKREQLYRPDFSSRSAEPNPVMILLLGRIVFFFRFLLTFCDHKFLSKNAANFFLKPQGAGVAGHVFSLANGTQATGMLLLQVGEFHDVSRLRRKAMKKNNNFEKPKRKPE